MGPNHYIHYQRIADAIVYIRQNFRAQPTLDQVAEYVHLSPFHFQRLFTEWAGVSPKKFLQYTSIQYARRMLTNQSATLFDVAHETGLSGTGRLHDLFVHVEGMTPGEYKNGGDQLTINHHFAESPFGRLLVASTDKGVCHMVFVEDDQEALNQLHRRFSNAHHQPAKDAIQQDVLAIFTQDWNQLSQIKLHLKGTAFQLKVWEALLSIPTGKLTTYGQLAQQIGAPKASRAVGSAVGSNPVAFLIPCHRVIQSSGALGGYHWGEVRKTAMIGWEAAQTDALTA